MLIRRLLIRRTRPLMRRLQAAGCCLRRTRPLMTRLRRPLMTRPLMRSRPLMTRPLLKGLRS